MTNKIDLLPCPICEGGAQKTARFGVGTCDDADCPMSKESLWHSAWQALPRRSGAVAEVAREIRHAPDASLGRLRDWAVRLESSASPAPQGAPAPAKVWIVMHCDLSETEKARPAGVLSRAFANEPDAMAWAAQSAERIVAALPVHGAQPQEISAGVMRLEGARQSAVMKISGLQGELVAAQNAMRLLLDKCTKQEALNIATDPEGGMGKHSRDPSMATSEIRACFERVLVPGACRNRCPLDGADAQALEHALTITERERNRALEEREKWRNSCLATRKELAVSLAQRREMEAARSVHPGQHLTYDGNPCPGTCVELALELEDARAEISALHSRIAELEGEHEDCCRMCDGPYRAAFKQRDEARVLLQQADARAEMIARERDKALMQRDRWIAVCDDQRKAVRDARRKAADAIKLHGGEP